MASLKELVATHGEAKVAGMVDSYLRSADRRKQYTNSPEAKIASKVRREKTKEELKSFRAWKESQGKGKK